MMRVYTCFHYAFNYCTFYIQNIQMFVCTVHVFICILYS